MITIDENTYILGYWFATNNDNCWYCMVVKQNDEEWVGQATCRYIKSNNDPFSGEDEKSITKFTFNKNESEEEIIKIIDKLYEMSKLFYNVSCDKFLVQGNVEKFMSIARTKDYIHWMNTH